MCPVFQTIAHFFQLLQYKSKRKNMLAASKGLRQPLINFHRGLRLQPAIVNPKLNPWHLEPGRYVTVITSNPIHFIIFSCYKKKFLTIMVDDHVSSQTINQYLGKKTGCSCNVVYVKYIFRGVFRIFSKICNGAFFVKIPVWFQSLKVFAKNTSQIFCRI